MKTPDACEGLPDIRIAIDSLDHQIVELMRQRMAYVKAAARYKPTESSIPAPERVEQMLPQRRQWAEEAGLDAHFMETLFAQIIHWCIAQQVLHWRATRTLA
ncbi:isochorismate lyase [Pseudomonas sp. RIT-PI-AD]|uniref:isochorismate lyase n=1 Tax=Pseudomonas sp. RIT-PI-AD TaxID=3035294 RepID=UPI0021D9EE91|nr:isochorismate lyase [Pseudomonas sp. RIT-PI-AD]